MGWQESLVWHDIEERLRIEEGEDLMTGSRGGLETEGGKYIMMGSEGCVLSRESS